MRALAVAASFLSACGSGSDGPELTDDTGPIIVIVRQGGSPRAGQAVYVQRPDWTLAAKVTTGTDGTVVIDDLPSGSAVTVRDGDALRTVLGVQPLDELLFNLPVPDMRTPVGVTVPATTKGDARGYLVSTTCGRGTLLQPTSTSGTLFHRGCASADVLVDVYGQTGDSLEWAYAPDRSLAGALDLRALAYTTTAPRSVVISNPPATWNSLRLARLLSTSKGTLYQCDAAGIPLPALHCPEVPGSTVLDRVNAEDQVGSRPGVDEVQPAAGGFGAMVLLFPRRASSAERAA